MLEPAFNAFIDRAGKEYEAMSPTPGEYKEFQRNWADDDLQKITTPVWIVEGDHDEAIKRENTEFMAVNIPGAGLMLQPQISHFSPGHGAILG